MRGETYFYSTRVLKDITNSYSRIYQGIEFYKDGVYHYTETNPWSIAEFKADFDTALRGIGRGKWSGDVGCEFRDYRYYGKLQQIIIAGILGVENDELEGLGFYNIPRLRGYAHYLMKCFLNGVDRNNKRCYDKDK